MSRVGVCCFVLFLFCVTEIASRKIDCTSSEPGSEKTKLHFYEKTADTWNKGKDKIGGWFGRNKLLEQIEEPKSSKTYGEFLSEMQKNSADSRVIFPGTLWCGEGTKAKDYEDLGRSKDTDACCREHDLCQNNILVGETKENLINNGQYTRSACACDNKFYNCLKKVGSLISRNVGWTYFSVLGPQCFQCVCSTDECKSNDSTECSKTCTKYKWVNNPSW